MKTFETLKDVLENAIEVHTRAAELYGDLARRQVDGRGQLLLESMIDHDRHMARMLRAFTERAGAGALGTYLQYTLEEPPEAFLGNLAPGRDQLTVDDLSALGQAVHHYLVDLVEEARRETASAEARELLGDILQLETAERQNFTRATIAILEM
jgi:hypothetical protein